MFQLTVTSTGKAKVGGRVNSLIYDFFFFFCSLGLNLQHMKVPRIGVELELQLLAYTSVTAMCLWPTPHLMAMPILNPLSEARDRTHVLTDTSWVCYCWTMIRIRIFYFLIFFAFFLGGGGPACGIGRVPGEGANQSYSCQPTPQPQQRQIWTASATYSTAHSNAGSLTHWARPEIDLQPHAS